MEKLSLDLKFALALIDNIFSNKKNMFSSLYPFSTENIKGYYYLIDFKDKDILTVGSSGDHTINLFLKNAKSVDFFDINPFCKYYYDFKVAAIKSLSYEDFISYFCFRGYPSLFKNNYKSFNLESYKKIRENLDNTSKKFWDFLYDEVDGIVIRNSSFFSKDEEPYKVIVKTNLYLQEENYKNTKEKIIEKINFYKSDISVLHERIDKKYDIIMLSNIFQYVDMMYKNDPLDMMNQIVLNLEKLLNDDGIILMCYMYGIDDKYDEEKVPIIYNLKKIEKMFKKLQIIKFRGISDLKYSIPREDKDGVLIYRKTK